LENEQSRRENASDDENFDTTKYYVCPMTRKPVNFAIMIPNKRLLRATEEYLERNPWAYDFDPRQQYT